MLLIKKIFPEFDKNFIFLDLFELVFFIFKVQYPFCFKNNIIEKLVNEPSQF